MASHPDFENEKISRDPTTSTSPEIMDHNTKPDIEHRAAPDYKAAEASSSSGLPNSAHGSLNKEGQETAIDLSAYDAEQDREEAAVTPRYVIYWQKFKGPNNIILHGVLEFIITGYTLLSIPPSSMN